MQLDLDHCKVLITGASKGLGAEIARGFVSEGAMTTLCSRRLENLEKIRDQLAAPPGQVWLEPVDATREEEIAACVARAAEKMGGIDIVINNVGGTEKFAGFFDLTEEDWLSTFRLNVLSVAHFARYCHPYLVNSGQPRILNINSVTALQPGGFSPHYSVSKAAALNLNKHLANLFAPDNILVNALIVGTFESDAWSRNIDRVAREREIPIERAAQEEVDLARRSIPLDRLGQGADIVPMVLLLSSRHSRWTTGSSLVIDGGKLRGIH